MLFRVGGDQRDNFAAAVDLFAAMTGNSRMPWAFMRGWICGTGRLLVALDVLGGHDLDDAGHFFGFGGIDADDFCMMDLGEDDGQVRCASGIFSLRSSP